MMAIFDNFDDNDNQMLEINEFIDMFVSTYIIRPSEDQGEKEAYSKMHEGDESGKKGVNELKSENSRTKDDKKVVHFEEVAEEASREARSKKPKRFIALSRPTFMLNPLPNSSQEEEIRSYLQKKLSILYSFVTKKDYLTKKEFMLLALNRDACHFFETTMKELDQIIQGMGCRSELIIPYSYEKMISYLGYSVKRDSLYAEFLNLRDLNFDLASEKLENILFLRTDEIKNEFEANEKLRKYRTRNQNQGSGSYQNFYLNTIKQYMAKFAKSYKSTREQEESHSAVESPGNKKGLQRLIKVGASSQGKVRISLAGKGVEAFPLISEKLKDKIKANIKSQLKDSSKKALDISKKALEAVRTSNKRSVLKVVKRDLDIKGFECKEALTVEKFYRRSSSNIKLKSRPQLDSMSKINLSLETQEAKKPISLSSIPKLQNRISELLPPEKNRPVMKQRGISPFSDNKILNSDLV